MPCCSGLSLLFRREALSVRSAPHRARWAFLSKQVLTASVGMFSRGLWRGFLFYLFSREAQRC